MIDCADYLYSAYGIFAALFILMPLTIRRQRKRLLAEITCTQHANDA